MPSRPEDLYPLFASTQSLPGIGPKSAQALEKAGLPTVFDMAMALPISVVDRRRVETLQNAVLPKVATVAVRVLAHRPAPRHSNRPYIVVVEDSAITFQLAFFTANKNYLEKQLPVGARRIVSGRAELFDGVIQITHPDHIFSENDPKPLPDFEPIYGLTAGISQKVMQRAIAAATKLVPKFEEWADPHLVSERSWPEFSQALQAAHSPKALVDIAPQTASRMRLAYDEVLAHQITLALVRAASKKRPGRSSVPTGVVSGKILKSLPFKPTNAQTRVIEEIRQDLKAPFRMNRLLQGDVGAGKTLVALLALATVGEAGGQGALMAPTEILARQHLDGLKALAHGSGLRIVALTGRNKGAERRAILEQLSAGEIDILVGTHAIFQSDVDYHDLRLAVIDEQHRFGVRQRLAFAEKGVATDVLIMTATPIPRSLALVGYGDMDVSVLDEKPPGRTPITTVLVPETRQDEVIARLKAAIEGGAQAFWICPLVNESEVSAAASAEVRFKTLRAVFGEEAVALVHGQMEVAQKDLAMQRFVDGHAKVLVATTVVEVGVDVPNASIMVIEGAETFGLSQVHQLRGRVGRGSKKSSCLLLYKTDLTETARQRLNLLRDTDDGFALSEADLKMRGAGDLIGTAQSGLPRFRIADLDVHQDLMELAMKDARNLVQSDPHLNSSRGQAVRRLLWLMKQDQAIRYFDTG